MTPLEKAELLEATLKDVYNRFDDYLHSCGQVCIAGGACRDTLMGVEPKDYDIFIVGIDPFALVEVKHFLSKSAAKQSWFKIESDHLDDYDGNALNIVYDHHKVQIIPRCEKDVESLLADFDLNVCMVAYGHTEDGPADYIFHDKFPDLNLLKTKKFDLLINNMRDPHGVIQRYCYMAQKLSMPALNSQLTLAAREICVKCGDLPAEMSLYSTLKSKIKSAFTAATTKWGS